MPPLIWPIDPFTLIQSFETRHKSPEGGALLAWAVRTMEGLYYLDDVDRFYDITYTGSGDRIPEVVDVAHYHIPEVVDVAHARWATGTRITALGLCAAGLGRSVCRHEGQHELDLTHFDLSQSSAKKRERAAKYKQLLPAVAAKWVDGVLADPDYQTIRAARRSLVHSRLTQHYTLAIGGPPVRLKLTVAGSQLGVRAIVELARDVATRHVSTFVNLLPHMYPTSDASAK